MLLLRSVLRPQVLRVRVSVRFYDQGELLTSGFEGEDKCCFYDQCLDFRF